LRVDDERVAHSDCNSVHCLNRPIQIDDLLVGIGQELEAQALPWCRTADESRPYHADAEDGGVGLFILREIALEIVGFDRAARGEIFRVKVEDDPLAVENRADSLVCLPVKTA